MSKLYPCIAADPAWAFRDKGSRISPDRHGRHYETMSLDEIIALGPQVRQWAAKDCHLWLWAPSAFVLSGDAQLVAKLWGFDPKQKAAWIKPQMGMGHWMRNAVEDLLLCVRGKLKPEVKNRLNWFMAPRAAHSVKPAAAYELIEAVSPGPRLEMFARSERDGWDSWGVEAPESTRIAEVG